MEKVKLYELADIYLGVTHTPEYVFDGVPFLSVKDISGGKICFDDCKYISQEEYDSLSEGAKPKVGDMLFCRVGTLGKPIIIPEGTPLFGSFVSLGYLRNKNADRCDLNYLRYWMYSNSFWKQVNSNVKGASQVNLNTGWLSKFDIDLPEMQEQKYRISVLDKCKVIIEQREEELKVLDDLIKARFVELFGDPSTNPKGYPVKVLPEIAEYWNGLTYRPEDVSDEGTIVLRSSNIQNATLDFADTVRVSCKIGDKKYVQDNDILMCSRNGSARLVGKVALIKDIEEPMSFGAFMMIIRSEYYPYLMTYFQMPAFRAQITTGATTTINQITGRMLDIVKLPVPDMDVINEFADFVHQVDKSKAAVQKSLDETQQLFDSLMQQYFG